MPRGFGRLPFLARRGLTADRAPGKAHGGEAPIDVDDAPVGPPVLLPAMIHRMILVDATELTPVWARPRAGGAQTAEPPPSLAPRAEPPPAAPVREPEPGASSAEPPVPKPSRKRKMSDTSGAPKAPTAPRKARKPAANRGRTS
jgi:hypothetical protein